jgi:hypothetical protein
MIKTTILKFACLALESLLSATRGGGGAFERGNKIVHYANASIHFSVDRKRVFWHSGFIPWNDRSTIVIVRGDGRANFPNQGLRGGRPAFLVANQRRDSDKSGS